jgi:outer membrane protein OmpA-like peptidoglycan-associated protein
MKNENFEPFTVPVRVACTGLRANVVVLLLLIMSGCATPIVTAPLLAIPVRNTVKDMIVLVQDADGNVGHITVTTKGGTRELTARNTLVEVIGSRESPSDPKGMAQTEIESLFADSSKALPPEPVSFLLYFLYDSKELTPVSKSDIAKILSLVNRREFCEISIIGHTDTTGKDEYNMMLSSVRAKAVWDALLLQGVHSGRMELRYHGKRDPLVPTGDNVKEPRNRRVEVVVK